MTGGAIAPHETDHVEKQKDKLLDASPAQSSLQVAP